MPVARVRATVNATKKGKTIMRKLPMLIAVLCMLWASATEAADKAHVPQTGQKVCYNFAGEIIICADTGQDGALTQGMPLPSPRFTDKGDGTIKDNLTGLIWLKNANCSGGISWQGALDFVAGINNGTYNCGDSSGQKGSHQTDWRLPNIKELLSLVNYAFYSPAISNAAGNGQGSSTDPFSNLLVTSDYWSSTTFAFAPASVWTVNFTTGDAGNFNSRGDKSNGIFVLPVRGGS